MDIKDLAGLKKPITKFIEVLSMGVGNVSKPMLTKRMTTSKVDEIERISQALAASNIPIKYENGKIIAQNFSDIQNELKVIAKEEDLLKRANSREEYKAIKKQDNIENISSKAFLNYMDDENLDKNYIDKKPDDDWINRFFDYAEDISSKEMQELWSRVLAGEIKKPNSYSLRTLDFLRNTSNDEAKAFEKIAKFIFVNNNPPCIYKLNDNFYKSKDVFYHDFLRCMEFGFLNHSDMLSLNLLDNNANNHVEFIGKNNYLNIERNTLKGVLNIPVYIVTNIGKEIFSLMNIKIEESYLDEVIKSIENKGCKVTKREIFKVEPKN